MKSNHKNYKGGQILGTTCLSQFLGSVISNAIVRKVEEEKRRVEFQTLFEQNS